MPITPKQHRIYLFIRGHIQSNGGIAPTIGEIGKHFNMTSSASVHAVLAILKREGLITIVPNVSRGIRLVSEPVEVGQSEVSEMVM